MVDRAPRILVIVGPATGGIGAHAAMLAGDIADRGATVAVVCPPLTAERFTWRVPVEQVWPAGRAGELVRRWRRLRELARTADIVHAQGHQAGLLALLAVRGARPRPAVVVSWHNAVLGRGPVRWLRGLGERVQARSADLVTGASLDLAARAASLGAHTAELAPVAAPRAGERVPDAAGARAQLVRDLALDPNTRLVLTVSRIAAQKRLDVLVEAARLLASDIEGTRRAGAPVTWLVAGDGDPLLADQLGDLAMKAGVDMRFLGAREDVPALLAAADVFALTSRWEARPLALQEAMAAGVPVVSTAVGGIAELLGDAGTLVGEGDAEALATAVGGLLNDPALRAERAEAGRRRFAQLPGRADITRSWANRYARLAPTTPGLR